MGLVQLGFHEIYATWVVESRNVIIECTQILRLGLGLAFFGGALERYAGVSRWKLGL